MAGCRLDQPGNAIECYSAALQEHPNDPGLLAARARVFEAIGQVSPPPSLHPVWHPDCDVCRESSPFPCPAAGKVSKSAAEYKLLLRFDSSLLAPRSSLLAPPSSLLAPRPAGVQVGGGVQAAAAV